MPEYIATIDVGGYLQKFKFRIEGLLDLSEADEAAKNKVREHIAHLKEIHPSVAITVTLLVRIVRM